PGSTRRSPEIALAGCNHYRVNCVPTKSRLARKTGGYRMKRLVTIVAGLLLASTSAFAQAPDADALDRALAPAPRNQKEAATVIKWKADNTYDTLRKGTNKLVCYER